MLPEALPYHLKVRDYFKKQTSTWEFFAAARTREEQLAAFQTELLKNSYQFRRETDTALYDKVDQAREKLGLGQLPVTVYQAQYGNDPELNASIIFLQEQAHIVFTGPILEKLNETELLAVIAHELTHVRLFTVLGGELEVADRIITAIANNHNSEPSYYETARLFKLYTEIFCDRGAFAVVGSTGPVISSLVKVATGLAEVNAEGYVQQAEEIFFAAPGTQSVMPTHPENFIRARALKFWADGIGGGNEGAITGMIEGRPELDRLDLFAQIELKSLTREFLQEFLQPEWFQSELVMALAKEYFNDFRVAGEGASERLAAVLSDAHPSIQDYFSYVLLDFALADPSLEDAPVGRGREFARVLGLTAAFEAAYMARKIGEK